MSWFQQGLRRHRCSMCMNSCNHVRNHRLDSASHYSAAYTSCPQNITRPWDSGFALLGTWHKIQTATCSYAAVCLLSSSRLLTASIGSYRNTMPSLCALQRHRALPELRRDIAVEYGVGHRNGSARGVANSSIIGA